MKIITAFSVDDEVVDTLVDGIEVFGAVFEIAVPVHPGTWLLCDPLSAIVQPYREIV